MPEWHRPVPAARVTEAEQAFPVEATAAECTALAARMGLVALRALACSFRLRRLASGADFAIEARGRLRAEVVQTCVVSLDPFPAVVEEAFTVHFVSAGDCPAEDDLAGFDPEAVDEIPIAGGVLDLGEAAAEQLALALDPYPRKPGAVLPAEQEPPAAGHPFAALRRH